MNHFLSHLCVWRSRRVFALLLAVYTAAAAWANLAAWDGTPVLNPWGVAACGVLLALPLTALFLRRTGHGSLLSAGQLWGLALAAAAVNICGNYYTFAAPGQMPLGILLTMGCACLLHAVFGRLAWPIWTLFFFTQLMQALGMLEYGSRFNSLVIAEALEASYEEWMAYMTPANIAALSLFVVPSALFALWFAVVLRRAPRMALVQNGLCFCALSVLIGACLPPHRQRADYYWPATELRAMTIAFSEALSLNEATINQAETLQSPAQEPSSISTLKGDEGVVLIFHVGESIRADRMSVNGYERDTTPWLRQQKELINFPDCISAACDTCEVELVVMTDGRRSVREEGARELQPKTGSVLDLFAANGFDVYTFFGRRCAQQLKYDRVIRVLTHCSRERFNAPGSPWTSVPQMQGVLEKNPQKNLVFFINNEGSHTPFDHYDRENPPFAPAGANFEHPSAHAEEVNNAYDSTIHYTDEFFRRVTEAVGKRPWVYVYISDHGEYLGHDGMWGRAALGMGHIPYHSTAGSRVGMFVLPSPQFAALHPHFADALEKLRAHRTLTVADEHIFHTLLGLFGIDTPHYDPALDLTSDAVQPYSGPKPE